MNRASFAQVRDPAQWATIQFVGLGIRYDIQLLLAEDVADQIVRRIGHMSGDDQLKSDAIYWFASGGSGASGVRLSSVDEETLREACIRARDGGLGTARPHVVTAADWEQNEKQRRDGDGKEGVYIIDPIYSACTMLDFGAGEEARRLRFGCGSGDVVFDTGNTYFPLLTVPISEKSDFLAVCTEERCSAKQFEFLRMLVRQRMITLREPLTGSGSGSGSAPTLDRVYQAISAPLVKSQLLALLAPLNWTDILPLFGLRCTTFITGLCEPRNFFATSIRYRIENIPFDLFVRAYVHFAGASYNLLLNSNHIADLAERGIVLGPGATVGRLLQEEKDALDDSQALLAALVFQLHTGPATGPAAFTGINRVLARHGLGAVSSRDELAAEYDRVLALFMRSLRAIADMETARVAARQGDGPGRLFWPEAEAEAEADADRPAGTRT